MEPANPPESLLPAIDGHCHAASMLFTPHSFVEGALDNVLTMMQASGLPVSRTRLMDRYLSLMQDDECNELVAEMDAADIDESVLLVPDFTYALDDCPLTVEEMLIRHRRIVEKHPGRFRVLAGVDPRWGPDGVDLFERAIRDFGFDGLKLYPPCGYSPSDPALFPFYEICARYRVPTLIHVGATSPALSFSFAAPGLVDDAARQFGGVNFILAHAPVTHTDECIELCRFRPNIYLDISGFQQDGPGGPAVRNVRRILDAGIHHKVIFGTDWPVFRANGSQRDFREYLEGEDGPFQDLGLSHQRLILRANATRLLKAKVAQGMRLTALPQSTGTDLPIGGASD